MKSDSRSERSESTIARRRRRRFTTVYFSYTTVVLFSSFLITVAVWYNHILSSHDKLSILEV
jgi:hypothetical protein